MTNEKASLYVVVLAIALMFAIAIGASSMLSAYNKGGEPPHGYTIQHHDNQWRWINKDDETGCGMDTRRAAVNDAWRWYRMNLPWEDEKPKDCTIWSSTKSEQKLPDGYSIAFNGSEYRFHDRGSGISTPRRSYESAVLNATFYEIASRFHLDKSLAEMLDEDLSGDLLDLRNYKKWPSGWTVVTGEVEHWNTVTVTNYVTVTNHLWPAYSWTNLIVNCSTTKDF